MRKILLIASLFLSVYASAQWNEAYNGINKNNNVHGISFLSPAKGYVAFSNYIGFTKDSGHSFVQRPINTANINYNGYTGVGFAFLPSGVKALTLDSLFVYGSIGTEPSILFSSDSGFTWKLVYHRPININASVWSEGITDFKMVGNSTTIYAIHHEEIIISTDRGQTWVTDFSIYDGLLKKLSVTSSGQSYAISKTAIYKSGFWWSQVTLPTSDLTYRNFSNIFFTNSSSGYATEEGLIYRTTDYGSTWTQMNDPVFSYASGNDMYFINDSTGFICGGGYNVIKTTDRGSSWEVCKKNTTYQYLSYGLNVLGFYNNLYAWAGGDGEYLLSTTKGGTATYPRAFFKVDTTNVYSTKQVFLNNFSKKTYQYKWLVNGTQVSTTYNANYLHNVIKDIDTIKLIVINGSDRDTMIQYQIFDPNVFKPLIIKSFYPNNLTDGDTVYVTGQKFTNTTNVTLGGFDAVSFSVISDSLIRVIVDTGSSGYIKIINPLGSDSINGFKHCSNATIQITANPDGNYCVGQTVKFNSFISSSDSLLTRKYKWFLDFAYSDSTPNFTANNLSGLPNVYCELTYSTGCLSSHKVLSNSFSNNHYSDQDRPWLSITSYPYGPVCPNSAITFSPISIINGGFQPHYRWKRNSILVDTNANYTTNNIIDGDTIVCEVTSSLNCLTSSQKGLSNSMIIQAGTKSLPLIYSAVPYSNYIQVFNMQNHQLEGSIQLLGNCFSFSIDTVAKKIYAAVYGNQASCNHAYLQMIDLVTNSVVKNIRLGNAYENVIVNPKYSTVYVTNTAKSRIDVYNSNTLQLIKSINLSSGCRNYFVVTSDLNKLYFALSGGLLGSINMSTNQLTTKTVPINALLPRCISKDNLKIYNALGGGCSNCSISVYNIATNTWLSSIKFVDSTIDDYSISPDGNTLWAVVHSGSFSSLIGYSLQTNKVIKRVSFYPYYTTYKSVSITPDSKKVSFSSYPDNYILTYDTELDSVFGTNLTSYCYLSTILNYGCINSQISGNIKSTKNANIKNYLIHQTGSVTSLLNSNSQGGYNLMLPITGNYTLRPSKTNDSIKGNGITGLDLFYLQNHLLNKTKLNNPYKLIAADVDGSKSIGGLDLFYLKKFLLGSITTFPNNRLWAFVDSAYIFPDTTNPFPFKDSISFTNLTSNKTNQTFIGVKLGDLNFDWDPAKARGVATKPVELVYSLSKEQLVVSNSVVKIPITVKNFKDLVAMQYTLHFDNTKYEFVGIENNKLTIDFNDKQATENGNISFVWTDKNADEKTLDDGSELFTLVLKAHHPSSIDHSNNDGLSYIDYGLSLTNDITDIAAWDKDLNQHNIILTKRETVNEKPVTRNECFSVSPNPTSGEIKVNIVCKTNKTIRFELNNAQGKTLMQQSFEAVKGNNTININLKKNTHLPTGIYFLKTAGLEGENVKKIVVQ